MLINDTQLNLGYKARVAKKVYTFVKLILKSKVLFFLWLKISYLKNNSYILLGELFLRLIDSIEFTNFIEKTIWNFKD